jgi:hypothetical protein
VATWQRRGLIVNTWTVNDADDVARVVAAGVDGVMADLPVPLLAALGRPELIRFPCAAAAPPPRQEDPRMPRFKLITSNSLELFEERINGYVEQLDRDETVVDVQFSTVGLGETIEYTALLLIQKGATRA